MDEILNRLNEYKKLLDFNNEFYKKDFKNNYKFTSSSVKKMIKKNEDSEVIISFLKNIIKIQKEWNKYIELSLNDYIK